MTTNEDRAGGFQAWVDAFAARALAAGIPEAIVTEALRTARFDPLVVERDRTQDEFTKAIWDYLDTAVSLARIANGTRATARHRELLAAIEDRYGVEAEIVAAIWGIESAYGAVRGDTRVVDALASLAFDGRRGPFFEEQLLAALQILGSGVVEPQALRGSWAGAMGHTQFMPTSYLDLAVDFSGDGRRDIWSDDPTDALASTAAYLASFGWQSGVPWGIEVIVPEGFDFLLADRRISKPVAEWADLGITLPGDSALPDIGPASLLLPAGADGAAFLVTPNFGVLERYNAADAYVIAVGHLADRLRGGPPLAADWPRGDNVLTLDERLELQRLLTGAGFDTFGVDGKIGPNTINAVRAYQQSEGLVADGYPSTRLLERLRG